MILELTLVLTGEPILIDTSGIVFTPMLDSGSGFLHEANPNTSYRRVKETIEEIKQQIKEGGVK